MKNKADVTLTPMSEQDLEIVMAWRSHPDIFKFFKQQNGPLHWGEHHSFWVNRANREDYIINVFENGHTRKVGNLNLSLLDSEYPEIGIFIGEITLQKKGVGTKAVLLGLKRLATLGHTKAQVSIHEDNLASRRLFEKFGFVKVKADSSSLWKEYRVERIVL